MITLGNSANMHDIKLGTTLVNAVYVGEDKVWPVNLNQPGIQEITQPEAVAGDVLFYNPNTDKLVFGRFVDTNPDYQYNNLTPIGIVAVPASHNVYGDNSCGIISLSVMSYLSPDNGTDEYSGSNMCWGYADTNLPNLNELPSGGNTESGIPESSTANRYGFAPSDTDENDAQCLHDKNSGYWSLDLASLFTPSPYLTNGDKNIGYSLITTPCSPKNGLADFDGLNNTNILCNAATSQNDWKTASSISNSSENGYFPAACCCWRYHTSGTLRGDWYLPALGEAGYMAARSKTIDNIIFKLESIYTNTPVIDMVDKGHTYYTSTTTSTALVRTISATARINLVNKSSDIYETRAFLRISSNNTPVHGEVQG